MAPQAPGEPTNWSDSKAADWLGALGLLFCMLVAMAGQRIFKVLTGFYIEW